ncbi:MAG TPA: polysaccharide deacetylase family protein [Kofleriaceae bacterium]|nr:polysaccharide deacetylase family protein [Kofleriaceae bacterium]
MSGPWVLMYHRICERDAGTRCWFERGTAITPAALDRHLAWLRERFAVVPLEDLHAPIHADARPRAALTFDDGYVDTLEIAAPICTHHGVVATCFATAGPARGGPALWFDTWYALVHAGLGHRDWDANLRALGIPATADLTACVHGSAKQWLAKLEPDARQVLLGRLAEALGVPLPTSCQLDLDGLRRLRRLGWRIGGHGIDHQRLGDCDELTVIRELRGSRQLLAEVGEPGPMQFAYPDGSWSERIADAVALEGFEIACTVQSAPWTNPQDRLTVPRLFCRGDAPVPHPLLQNLA